MSDTATHQRITPSHSPPDQLYAPGIGLSRKLGWFGIGLGCLELLAPRTTSELTGVEDLSLLEYYGARELVCGIGILNSKRPTGWMWARVAGDLCDLTTLGLTIATKNHSRRQRAEIALLLVAGITIVDVLNATTLSAAAALERRKAA